MDRKLLITLLAYTALIGGIYLIYVILGPFLQAIGWAVVVAIATYPLYRKLAARLKGRDWLAATLMTAGVFVLLVVPVSIVLALLVQDVVEAERLISRAIKGGGNTDFATVLQHPYVAPWVERATEWAAMADINLTAAAGKAAQTTLGWLLGSFGTVLKNLFVFLFQLFLVVVALFFVYRDGVRAESALWAVVPMSHATKSRVRETSRSVVAAVVSGVLVTAAVQALLAGLAYWVSGLPSVVLLGALTFIAAFIPVVGTALIWLPAGLYLLLTGEPVFGIGLLIWGAIVISGVDSVLRPWLISGGTGLPLSLMMLGALGGLLAFGFSGLIIGPLTLALLLVLFEVQRSSDSGGQRQQES
ncbi:MAG: AI-2E family transporter [Pseudomonadota bacterium]|nr:MAG: AI-2E family transporter [Pseudomonadota bacterium]